MNLICSDTNGKGNVAAVELLKCKIKHAVFLRRKMRLRPPENAAAVPCR